MTEAVAVAKLVQETEGLKSFWAIRNRKFKEWYNMLLMVDELKQDDMESFVSNDPRTAYNLSLHLLSSQEVPHKVPVGKLLPEQIGPAGTVEAFLKHAWEDVAQRHRRKGRQFWLRELVSFIVAVGWYSVFAIATDEACFAEIWNPADVYPRYGEDGMDRVVHIYPMQPDALNRKIKAKEWQVANKITAEQVVRDYWKYDDNGEVVNYIMIGNQLVTTPPSGIAFETIPVFVSPVGGLPDMGSIVKGKEWRAQIGQSMIATNETVYKYLNKHWSFSLQLLRDTAQARWFEKSRSGEAIMKPEDVFKRGAIFRGSPEDSLEALQVPPIPVELRSDRLDMEAMLQRGGPPYSLYGNIQQSMSAYMMAQVASAAQQSFKPYHQAVIDVLTDIDNHWITMMRKSHFKPYDFDIPKEITEDIKITASYDIKVPGDLAQKATVARMLSPTFKLSETRVMDELFPEITNPMQEQAQSRKDMAMQHPVMAAINLIQAFKAESTKCREIGDTDAAELYDKAAIATEATITPRQEAEAGAGPPVAPGQGEVPRTEGESASPPV